MNLKQDNPQHQLTGSEELDDLLRSMWPSNDPRDQFRYEKDKEAILSWHTKHRLKGQIEVLEKVTMSCETVRYEDHTAGKAVSVRILNQERADLKNQLASMEKTE